MKLRFMIALATLIPLSNVSAQVFFNAPNVAGNGTGLGTYGGTSGVSSLYGTTAVTPAYAVGSPVSGTGNNGLSSNSNQNALREKPPAQIEAPFANCGKNPSTLTTNTSTPNQSNTLGQNLNSLENRPSPSESQSACPKNGAILLSVGQTLNGTAYAVGSSRVKLSGQTIFLAGLNAPAEGQICSGRHGRWHCGDLALDKLRQIVDGHELTCVITSSSGTTLPEAKCRSGMDDISNEMIADGMGTSTEEDGKSSMEEARSDHRGMWTH
jgi:endonuclease YncB( thermonuclease family)